MLKNWSRHYRKVWNRSSIPILGTWPKRISFDNSLLCPFRSEANDLAIRLARAYTGGYDIIALDKYLTSRKLEETTLLSRSSAYHGHLSSLVELSTYEFKKYKCEKKAPEHVHVVSNDHRNQPIELHSFFQIDTPDVYRGKYRDIDYNYDENKICQLYLDDIRRTVEEAESRGRRIAIFLIETLQSCGGQIVYPKGYLKKTFE